MLQGQTQTWNVAVRFVIPGCEAACCGFRCVNPTEKKTQRRGSESLSKEKFFVRVRLRVVLRGLCEYAVSIVEGLSITVPLFSCMKMREFSHVLFSHTCPGTFLTRPL